MEKQRYHNRRVRQTCFSAGHVHCPNCDRAIAVGRDEAKYPQDYGWTGAIHCVDCSTNVFAAAIQRPH